MPQNKYKLSFMIGNPDLLGLSQIYLRVFWNKKQFRIRTNVAVEKKYFNGKEVVKHINKKEYNTVLSAKYNEIQKLLINADLQEIDVDKNYLNGIVKSQTYYYDFCEEYLKTRKGIISDVTVNRIRIASKKAPNIILSKIDHKKEN